MKCVGMSIQGTVQMQNYSQTALKNTFTNNDQQQLICSWCRKLGGEFFTLQTDNNLSKSLCSEMCFNRYRRASFKKNKDGERLRILHSNKFKSSRNSMTENVSKRIINDIEHHHHHHQKSKHASQRHSITNVRPKEIVDTLSSSSSSSSVSASLTTIKHQQSSFCSSKIIPTTNAPLTCSYPSSIFPPHHSIDQYNFQYPNAIIHPIERTLPQTKASAYLLSTLLPMLTKDSLSNPSCNRPGFHPFPSLMPLCLSAYAPYSNYSSNAIN